MSSKKSNKSASTKSTNALGESAGMAALDVDMAARVLEATELLEGYVKPLTPEALAAVVAAGAASERVRQPWKIVEELMSFIDEHFDGFNHDDVQAERAADLIEAIRTNAMNVSNETVRELALTAAEEMCKATSPYARCLAHVAWLSAWCDAETRSGMMYTAMALACELAESGGDESVRELAEFFRGIGAPKRARRAA